MTKSKEVEMFSELDKASQYRKQCEARENKIRRLRNLFLISLFASVVLVIISLVYMKSLRIHGSYISMFYEIMPIISYVAALIGILSLIWLIVAFLKSFNIEQELNNARRAEGKIVKSVFRTMYADSKK